MKKPVIRGKRTSKYYGVTWNKNARKWEARIGKHYMGLHRTEDEAHIAVQAYLSSLETQERV